MGAETASPGPAGPGLVEARNGALRAYPVDVARILGAAAVGVVGQMAVDMPAGFFGARDEITVIGTGYAIGILGITVALILLLRARRSGIRWLFPVLLAGNVGVFLPAVLSDPVVAGMVVIWNLTLMALHLFPYRDRPLERSRRDLPSSLVRAVRHLAAVSLGLTVAVVGYRLSDALLAHAVCLVLGYGLVITSWPLLRALRRRGSRTALFVLVATGASILSLPLRPLSLSLLAVAEVSLLLALLAQHESAVEVLRAFYDAPSRLIATSFATAILLGTVFLTFPAASAGPNPIPPLDALFTATSATCVTGLIVLDTPTAFSTFGHLVILFLFQVGGLGIMVVSTFATLLLGGSLGLKGEGALTEMLDIQAGPAAYRLIRFIVLSALTLEALGAALLTLFFHAEGAPWGTAAWKGIFHSVSAFCNAGFALQSDSLVLFRQSSGALLTVALLITLGGLGFGVLATLGRWTRDRSRAPFPVHAKVVLAVSLTLVLLGTGLYATWEWNHSLAGLSIHHKIVNSLFQSVTLRTAGFNSVSFEALTAASLLFMVLFMFIGASPGSAGGGVKTTTAAVLIAAIRSAVRSDEPTKLFGREVPREVVLRSLAIVIVSGFVVLGGLFVLLTSESSPFQDLLFEAMSAFGTVGLSMGATPELGTIGKIVIIGLMFVGRIGPLTLALFLGTGSGTTTPPCRYPETRLMVG